MQSFQPLSPFFFLNLLPRIDSLLFFLVCTFLSFLLSNFLFPSFSKQSEINKAFMPFYQKAQIKQKLIRMNFFSHSKPQKRPVSFFSTNLSPQNQTQAHVFETELDQDPIYFMAEEVKRKLSKSSRKNIKKDSKTHLSFVDKATNEQQTNFQSSPTHKNTTIFTSKSLNPKKQRVFNVNTTIQDERRLLSKITIHRIRSQREQLESETKRIANSYNYLFQRIQKEKKKSIEVKTKQQKAKEIYQRSLKMRDQLDQERANFLQQKSLEKSRLRDTVLKQKKNKEKSLVNFYNNLHKNASQIRLESQKIDEEILRTQLGEIEKKKNKYLTEKQQQKRRLLTREISFQNRKLQAQTQFKQKWLREFNQTSKARKVYLTKKDVLNKKMQKLYDELRTQQDPLFESSQKQRACTRVENRKNPQQPNFYF